MRTLLIIILLFLLMIVVIPALAIFRLVRGTRSRQQSQQSPFQAEEEEDLSTEEKLANKRFDKSKAEDVEYEEVKE